MKFLHHKKQENYFIHFKLLKLRWDYILLAFYYFTFLSGPWFLKLLKILKKILCVKLKNFVRYSWENFYWEKMENRWNHWCHKQVKYLLQNFLELQFLSENFVLEFFEYKGRLFCVDEIFSCFWFLWKKIAQKIQSHKIME